MAWNNYTVTKKNFRYASQAKVESAKGEAASDKWHRPSSPVHERPPQVVESISTKVQTEVTQPTRPLLLGATNWRKPRNVPNSTDSVVGNTNTFRGENNNIDTRKVEAEIVKEAAKSSSSAAAAAAAPQLRFPALTSTVPKRDPMHERPPEVAELITRIQTEVNQPTRPAIVSATNWRNLPNSTGQVGGNINTSGDEKYTNNKNYYNQGSNGLAEPNANINKVPPSSDIEKAVENLKELAAKASPAAPKPRFIDSERALKLYNGVQVPRSNRL